MKFTNNLAVHIYNQWTPGSGGAVHAQKSTISFEDQSTVSFSHNRANYGGAVHARLNSIMCLNGSSRVTFLSNYAKYLGGAVDLGASITFD